MDTTHPSTYDISDYLGMARRHWWIVVLAVLAGAGTALGVAGAQPPVYESTISVLVAPIDGQDANASGGRTSTSINLDTEAQLVTSTDVAAAARDLLKVGTDPGTLVQAVSVSVPPNTTVLDITYAAGSGPAAQSGARAFATAYLTARHNSAQADLTAQIAALDAKVKQYSASLAQLSGRIATMPGNDPTRADVNAQIATLTNQINTLTSRENQLATTTVTAGRVISDAPVPARPARPSRPLFAGSGAILGLLLGLVVAVLRQRMDRRVRRLADLTGRAGVAVLAALPGSTRARFDDVYPPYATAGRMFNRLRNEVLASLRPGDQVLVVAGASRGVASTLVAANLAAALARAGSEVVLVCAHLPDSMVTAAPASRLLGVAAVPGLSDVLAGKVALDTAIQRAPRTPNLLVLTTGGTASAAGLVQSQALGDTVAALKSRVDYVVIEAPSTAASADAQSLAGLADAAILAVELRRTRHGEVSDASEQFHRVGTPLLGTVVLPRLRAEAVQRPSQPAAALPGLDSILAGVHPAPVAAQPAPAAQPAAGQPAAGTGADTLTMPRLDGATLARMDSEAGGATR